MIEQVLAKIVYDRTCPFCMGIKHAKFEGTNTVPQPCKMCNGESYLYKDRPTVLVVPHVNALPTGVVKTLETQNVVVFHPDSEMRVLEGKRFKALYFFDVEVPSRLYNEVLYSRDEGCEIHIYSTNK